MTFWIILAGVAVLLGYLLGRFFKPSTAPTIVVTLDGRLNHVSTVPDPAPIRKGEAAVWEIVIQSPNPPDIEMTMEFDSQHTPFKKAKCKSGKGSAIFGDRTKGNANEGDYKYSIFVDGTKVTDPVIQIRP